MTFARPGREQQQDLRALVARDDPPLVGSKGDERPGVGLEGVTPGYDPGAALDDDEKSVLLHLVVAELLARLEADQNRSALVPGVQDDGRATPVGRLDLGQPPAPHAGDPNRRWAPRKARLDSPHEPRRRPIRGGPGRDE